LAHARRWVGGPLVYNSQAGRQAGKEEEDGLLQTSRRGYMEASALDRGRGEGAVCQTTVSVVK